MSNITFVSGYWAVSSKHSNDDYMDYFTTSLSLNQRYIFFCEKNQIDVIKKYRKGNKTDFI